ncbi:hypothetical protein [Streptomyces sp. NBC_01428]|uniref:hypothetical protein n=1 Tax=Streptomyces sp. NBC_01428 TaxID=2903861 RepID=UPI002E309779|nr:hypothetical protein [Streptomyces sp. NBC_01428]
MMNIANELKSIIRTRKVVDGMMWVIAAGAILFSLMTGGPLVALHSQWVWTGWVLPSVVDAALVLSLSADSVLSRHGKKSGKWATAFRWVTGTASLFLNTWTSTALGDWVGVGIHSIAPLILVFAAEVAPVYRRKFREVELELSEQMKEFTVTKTVSKKSSLQSSVQVQNSGVQPARGSHITEEVHLTDNQKAIRDGFLNNRKASEVAKEIGVSNSYVSGQYRKIRDELELTA